MHKDNSLLFYKMMPLRFGFYLLAATFPIVGTIVHRAWVCSLGFIPLAVGAIILFICRREDGA
jgi:hypothetical protein